MRINKYIAKCGICSRRRADELIKEGRVTVNGIPLLECGMNVDETAVIAIDGQPIAIQKKLIYIAMNKPCGYVCTASDEMGRRTVYDLLTGINERLFTIGRLDKDTEGLILLTNDGSLTQELLDPKKEIEKSYEVLVKGMPSLKVIKKLSDGITIDTEIRQTKQNKLMKSIVKYHTKPAKIFEIGQKRGDMKLVVIIKEGKKRQIRKMFDVIGHKVIKLKRIKFAGIELGDLRPGEFRHLSEGEVRSLCSLQ